MALCLYFEKMHPKASVRWLRWAHSTIKILLNKKIEKYLSSKVFVFWGFFLCLLVCLFLFCSVLVFIIISSELSFFISPLSKVLLCEPQSQMHSYRNHALVEWRAGIWILCGALTWNHKFPHDNNNKLNLCDTRKRIWVEFHYYSFKNFWCFVFFSKRKPLQYISSTLKIIILSENSQINGK